MWRLDFFGGGEVGDGAGNLEDAVVGAGGEGEFFHGLLEKVAEGGIDRAVLADLGVGHAGVDGRLRAFEAGVLACVGCLDAGAHRGGGLAWNLGAQFLEGQRRRLDMQVDAVQERTADPRAVALDLGGAAAAFVLRVSQISAGAWLRCQVVI